ncbi:MAG TPA: formylmethanofuran--tetrahydromethanopterin N-formyltransferase [Euryarchaeota archaeon]|nr:formyltransferase/hydrolase complex subunit D [archaeon BMS3Bbin15]HDL16046.1 formylmethanofuran--tetrahydromethanopterin N-formyltransferase [Euryarchaeota archaeon]
MKINNVEVEDTYCEAFEGIFVRMLITAERERYLRRAASGSSCLPSTVVGRTEGGVEAWVSSEKTPDSRAGSIVQIWGNGAGKDALRKFGYELSIRIRQGILVVPTTKIFNLFESDIKIDTMPRVGHCGDGYETVEERFGREMINVPLMMGNWFIEHYLGVGKGVAGGNLWFFCTDEKAALEAGEAAVEAIEDVEGVITPFDVCSAGSKVETKFPEIGPTTNHPYCPTLKAKIKDSKVPKGVVSIPEVIINGTTLDAVKKAMLKGAEAASRVDGVVKISSGNFGGKLGKHKIFLRNVLG